MVGNDAVGRWDYLGLLEEGETAIHVFDFNDIEIEVKIVLGLAPQKGEQGRIDLASWEVDDYENWWDVNNDYFFKPDDYEIELSNELMPSLKKTLKGKKNPIIDLGKNLMLSRLGQDLRGFELEIEYEFMYKYMVCKKRLFSDELYESWSWKKEAGETITIEAKGERNFSPGQTATVSNIWNSLRDEDKRNISKTMHDAAKIRVRELEE